MTIRGALAGLICLGAAVGMGGAAARQADNTAASTKGNVYIHDSGPAAEKLALAERMERLGEWGNAADIYQDMLGSMADRLVPRTGQSGSYTSVKLAVQERIAHWPAEGLKLYRDRYESAAARAMEKAEIAGSPLRDPIVLDRVFNDYFVTEAGKRAGLLLIEQELEGGDFAAAMLASRRLLDLHPTLGADRPMVLYHGAVAAFLAGDAGQEKQFADELKKNFPDATGTVRGQSAKLAAGLDQELASLHAAADSSAAARGESWPMAFGSPDRAAVAQVDGPAQVGPSQAGAFARLYSLDLDAVLMPSIPQPNQRHDLQVQMSRERSSGSYTGIFPVVDRDELFFQDNARVYAVALDSGLPMAGWLATYPRTQGRFAISAWSPAQGQQCTLTLTDRCVLGVMGQPDKRENDVNGQLAHETQLVCLDRHDGRLLWSFSPRQFPAEPPALRQLDLCGSPLCVNGSVYLTARGGGSAQFEDCYVVCIDAASGKFRWASYLASAGNDLQVFDTVMGGTGTQNASHLAYSGGLIYACSNVGAAAALDALSGTVEWLDLYPRQEVGDQAWANFQLRQRFSSIASLPWTYNPVIVSGNRVFMLPSDGTQISIYDTGSGTAVSRIPLAKFDNANTLIGVVGSHLIVAAQQIIRDIDWPAYRPDPPAPQPAIAADDLCHWAQPITPERAGDGSAPTAGEGVAIIGRPFLTGTKLYVSTPAALLRFDIKSGRRESRYPETGTWESDEGPGNVLVTADHVVVAGDERVVVYSDPTSALAKLDASIAASPNDAQPRILSAEILFVAGKIGDSVNRLDQAATIVHGSGNAAMRDRLFGDAMTFAAKLQTGAAPDATAINGLYDRAAAWAADGASASQQVTYALRRAEWSRTRSEPAAELKLLQAILLDRRQRLVAVGDGPDAGKTAAQVARAGIDQILAAQGRGIYADIEGEATEKFHKTGTSDSAGLIELAWEYPNSEIAPDALLAAATACDTANDLRGAAAARRVWLRSFADAGQRQRVIEDLAGDYLGLAGSAGLNAAADLLAGSAVATPNNGPAGKGSLIGQLRLPDGRVLRDMTLADAAAQIEQAGEGLTPVQPDPMFRAYQRHAAGPTSWDPFDAEAAGSAVAAANFVPAMTGTSAAGASGGRFGDRVIVYVAGAGLEVFGGGSSKAVLTCAAAPEHVFAAGFDGDAVLAACDDRLLRIEPDGQVAWELTLKALPRMEVAMLGTSPRRAKVDAAEAADEGDNDVAGMRERVIIRARIQAGNGIMVQQLPNGRIIAQPIGKGAGGIVAAGGRMNALEGTAPTDSAQGAERITRAVSAGGRLVAATSSGRVLAVDEASGHVAWQSQIEDEPIAQLLANDDYVAVRSGNVIAAPIEAGLSDVSPARVEAFDATDGQIAYQHNFGAEDGGAPINMALSPGGALVWMTPDRIVAKDLLSPGEQLRFSTLPWAQKNTPVFATPDLNGARATDQLVIDGGRIVAVADSGQALRVFDLASGKPLALPRGSTRINIAYGANAWQVHIRAAGHGTYYAVNPTAIQRFDFEPTADRPGALASWRWPSDRFRQAIVDDAVLAGGYVVAFYERVQRHPPPIINGQPTEVHPSEVMIDCINPGTAYVELQKKNLIDVTGIVDERLVDGGMYYLTGEGRLHFLPGGGRK